MADGLNILMVGAGAVGQAYGFHLQRAGHRVTFLVKPHYVDALKTGLDVHCLNGRAQGSYRFNHFACLTLDEVGDESWDQVWLCMSSTALQGGWLETLSLRVDDALIVMLQPGLFDREYVLNYVTADRLVQGMIGLVSFKAPLPGSTRSPGMTWWFPPLGPSLFSGPVSITQEVVNSLKSGGCPAKRVRDVAEFGGFGSAVLMPLIAALECAQWSLSALRSGPQLALASGAARQATQLARPGQRRVIAWCVTQPLVLRLILTVAPMVTPFNLEEMLKSHFTKVGDQTRAMLEKYLVLASERDEPSDAIAKLTGALTACDP